MVNFIGYVFVMLLLCFVFIVTVKDFFLEKMPILTKKGQVFWCKFLACLQACRS